MARSKIVSLIIAQIPVVGNPHLSRSPRCTSSENFMSNFHPIPCDVVIVFTTFDNDFCTKRGKSMSYEYQVRMHINRE